MEDTNKQELVAKLRNLVSSAEGEFTPEASNEAVELRNAIEAINTASNQTEDVAAAGTDTEVIENRTSTPTNLVIRNNMDNNKFFVGDALKSLLNGEKATGVAAEFIAESNLRSNTTESFSFHPEAYMEMRDNVFGTADGTTGTGVYGATHNLRPKSIFDNVNVTRLPNMTQDMKVPVGANLAGEEVAEGAAGVSTAGSFTSATLTPQRITGKTTVSNQLRFQSSEVIENFLMADLMRAVGQAKDAYLVKQLYADLTAVDYLNATTYAALLTTMESALDTAGANRDNAEFIVAPSVFASMRDQAFISSVNAITGRNSILGYNTTISSNATDATDGDFICLGDFSDFLVADWGGVSLKLDEFTRADEDEVDIRANQYVDGMVRRTGNFSIYHSIG